MEAGLQSNQLQGRKLKREMITLCHQMKKDIGLILFITVNYYLNKVIAKTLINVKHRHEKKLVNTKRFMELVPTLVDFMELQRYIKFMDMIKLINSLYSQ